MTYFIFKCPNCGNIQVQCIKTELIGKTFKCFRCNKSRKIKSANKYWLGLIIAGEAEHPSEAAKICAEIKMREGEKNELNKLD